MFHAGKSRVFSGAECRVVRANDGGQNQGLDGLVLGSVDYSCEYTYIYT